MGFDGREKRERERDLCSSLEPTAGNLSACLFVHEPAERLFDERVTYRFRLLSFWFNLFVIQKSFYRNAFVTIKKKSRCVATRARTDMKSDLHSLLLLFVHHGSRVESNQGAHIALMLALVRRATAAAQVSVVAHIDNAI